MEQRTYYVLVCRRGGEDDKVTYAATWILDDQGKIFKQLDEMDGVLGITDANRDGTHELILMYGNSYGGGVQVMYLYWDSQDDKLQLNFGSQTETMFD